MNYQESIQKLKKGGLVNDFIKVFVEDMKTEFPTLTIEYAKKTFEELANGNEPTNVIAMFMKKSLES